MKKITNLILLHLVLIAFAAMGCRSAKQTDNVTLASANVTMPFSEITTAKGNKYRLIQTTDQDDFQEIEHRGFMHLFSFRSASVDEEEFDGDHRMAAKTSIASAQGETFMTLGDLLKTLQTDDDMINHNPPISKSSDSDRISDEKRNVTVDAFIYESKHEDDNDFHVILGSGPNGGDVEFLNVEISGLPSSGPDRETLLQARKDFIAFFQGTPPSSRYKKIDPPLPVRVSGSLFYDIDHGRTGVGPVAIRPHTMWEIHPVTKIIFEP